MKSLILLSLIVGLGLTVKSAQAQNTNVHAFKMAGIDGEDVNLSDYKGKALLIVNTASKCGYTKQYKSLETLYQTYKDKGFEVLAFPANNFGGQEPGTNEQIKDFCYLKFKTGFPLFAKTSVKGEDINPLYKYLTEETPYKGEISWNFNKFLVDPNGEVVARFESKVDPLDTKVTKELEKILPAQ